MIQKEIIKQLITKKLKRFLSDRKDIFKSVSPEQLEKWEKSITKQVFDMLNDNDIFYDNMPVDVEETYS